MVSRWRMLSMSSSLGLPFGCRWVILPLYGQTLLFGSCCGCARGSGLLSVNSEPEEIDEGPRVPQSCS